ncbi:unnamed protein product [Zymoseptoria tritici ST99CH_1A5]|nr:unnamed protein product [Zymoseptoria tritici ST99CH_1A5]
MTYEVHIFYLGILNEHVKEVISLRTILRRSPSYLKLREYESDGVYAWNLTDEPVKSSDDMSLLMKMGDLKRTTAASTMIEFQVALLGSFTMPPPQPRTPPAPLPWTHQLRSRSSRAHQLKHGHGRLLSPMQKLEAEIAGVDSHKMAGEPDHTTCARNRERSKRNQPRPSKK